MQHYKITTNNHLLDQLSRNAIRRQEKYDNTVITFSILSYKNNQLILNTLYQQNWKHHAATKRFINYFRRDKNLYYHEIQRPSFLGAQGLHEG